MTTQVDGVERAIGNWAWWFFLLPAVIGLCFSILFAFESFGEPNYRICTVVYPVIMGLVLWQSIKSSPCSSGNRKRFAFIFWSIGILFSILGAWFFSPSVYLFSIPFLLIAWLLACINNVKWTTAVSISVIAILSIPANIQMVGRLSEFINTRSARVIGSILDALGRLNFM